jgi:hypothetical protein
VWCQNLTGSAETWDQRSAWQADSAAESAAGPRSTGFPGSIAGAGRRKHHLAEEILKPPHRAGSISDPGEESAS